MSNRMAALARCHIHGFKAKVIANALDISEAEALDQMNTYLHLLYGSAPNE